MNTVMKMKVAQISTATLAYQIYGTGKIDLVIEKGLGALAAEWQPIAKKLALKHTVLLYERAGYGESSSSSLLRTPENIAEELYELLQGLECKEQIILLAHSQGGLYAQKFVRKYPAFVKKLILLDPLSAGDDRFCKELTAEEFRKSGVDKTAGLKINLLLAKLHLGCFIRSMMRKAPPFYYYDGFLEEEKKYILDALTKSRLYQTALAEYQLSHEEEQISDLKEKAEFPDIPIILITHNSETEIGEICAFGGASREQAEKIEKLWQQLMKEYLNFSTESRYECAVKSSHYIHLTDMELVCRLTENED